MNDGLRFPWDMPAVPVVPPGDPDLDEAVARRKPGPPTGCLHPGARRTGRSGPMVPPLDDQPAGSDGEQLRRRGPRIGIMPWQLDYAAIEEDIFVRAVSQPASRRTVTVEGCCILARQFHEKVEVCQACAAALSLRA